MPEGGTGVVGVETAARPQADAARTRAVAGWREASLAFACAFVALVVVFIDTAIDLVDGWNRGGTFAHGYMILPVSAWLVWRMRDELAMLAPRVQPLALLPLAACGVVWLAGQTAGAHTPTSYAFIAMIPCVVWGIFGNAVTSRLVFPLAFLFFAVPAGDFLMPTLMDHTADFTVAALRLSGVPVFREGNFFTIPSGNWSVVEACSGLRYLIASITLGCLFAYLNYRSKWRRVAFVVASIAVPIIANWLRAYLIVMIAHLSSNALATGVDHLVYGWLFFGLVMMLLFWVGNLWREDDDEPSRDANADAAARRVDRAGATPSRGLAVTLVTVAMICTALPWPALASWLGRIADAAHPGQPRIDGVAGWSERDASITAFVPHYQRARTSLNRAWTSGDRHVQLFIGYYSGQATNGSLVTFGNDVVVPSDKVWGSVARRATTATVGGDALPVVEDVVRRDGADGSERLLTWRWYWINGRVTTNDYVAKAYTALDKITGRGDDSAVVVVTTPIVAQDVDAARATAAAFVAAAEPRIVAGLAALREEGRK